jgi:hypothetical protein
VSIGRTAENDFVLPHVSVSRRHASLTRQGDTVVVRDLGSANGTFLGEERVRGEAQAKPGGPPINIGPFQIKIEGTWAGASKDDLAGTMRLQKDGLQGSLETMPLGDFLQGVELNARTGLLKIESSDGGGEIVFAEGAPLRASFGSDTGAAAIRRMLLLKSGRFTYSPGPEATQGPREVEETFIKLILDVSRVSDEEVRSG